jgi:hypothetical protein
MTFIKRSEVIRREFGIENGLNQNILSRFNETGCLCGGRERTF